MSLLTLDPNFKPAFDGQRLAQDLIDKVSAQSPVVAAYLFGSSSVGKNTADSDIDILLVIPDGTDVKAYYKFVSTPFFSTTAVDWIIKTKIEFENSRQIGGISMVASATGIELKINGSN